MYSWTYPNLNSNGLSVFKKQAFFYFLACSRFGRLSQPSMCTKPIYNSCWYDAHDRKKKIWWCWFRCSSCVERKISSGIHIKFLKFELFEGFYQLKNWKRDETFCLLRSQLIFIQFGSGYCSNNVRAAFHNNTFAYLCTKLNKLAKYLKYHEPVEKPLIINHYVNNRTSSRACIFLWTSTCGSLSVSMLISPSEAKENYNPSCWTHVNTLSKIIKICPK